MKKTKEPTRCFRCENVATVPLRLTVGPTGNSRIEMIEVCTACMLEVIDNFFRKPR